MMPMFCRERYMLLLEEHDVDGEYAPQREELRQAGLSEELLRQMEPDDRVVALEAASLDPYDFIYLAC